MTAELATVCVALVAVTGYALWATSSRAEWKRKATDRANRIVCLRATIAAGNTTTEIDPVARGVEAAHLVLAAADTEHVEADPAGAMPRVVPIERGRG